MWETVGQALWGGAIERLASNAAPVFGAALTSNLSAMVRNFYPALRASSQAALVRYAYEAIGAARAYQNGPAGFLPLLGQIPNLFQPIEYSHPQGWLAANGYTRGYQYSFTLYTTNENLTTGAITDRANEISVFSNDLLTRQQAEALAHMGALEWLNFRSGTDQNNFQQISHMAFNAVSRTYGE